MTRISGLVFAAALAAAPTAAAQDPPPTPPPAQQPPPPAQTPVATPEPGKVTPEPMTRERFHARRNAIGIMEGALIKAVEQGAKELMGQIKERVGHPVAGLVNGYARARGFILEDYGVMFHVEIPGVQAGVLSLFEQMQRQPNDPRAERTGPNVPFDVDAAYTDTVKSFLTNTMLTYSIGLDLDPAEWLTIAARDGVTPPPGAIYESITMVIRIRGGDLADFHAKRISREDVLKRVQIRGF